MNSFISWIGGKRLLRNKILEQFPDTEIYDRYIEVFGGAGWILFAKEKHAVMEVFNDANSELINLYRCVKYHYEALQKELDWMFVSREQFFDCKEQLISRGLTDIQKAARYFILIKNSFGTDLRSFGLKGKNLENSIDYLKIIKERLSKVVIENKDFESILKTYDRKNSLFYLDPPYYKTEGYYDVEFTKEDHSRLKEALCKIKGKFVLSYNDCDYIKDLYSDYNIIEVERQNSLLTKVSSEKYKEIIIKNF